MKLPASAGPVPRLQEWETNGLKQDRQSPDHVDG
jgi:hypothetical protein